MKKHAIIPIFIPHKGCPNDCIFCNQKKITARQKSVTGEDVYNTIETWLSTIEKQNLDTVEVAFFGGSFTGIPIEEQNSYLAIAKEYKDAGKIDKIHMSTRPDYINEEILDNLKKYDVDTIELGVQSFDDRVLALSNRGHDSSIVYKSSELIKSYGFELGIQLMIGLPGDSLDICLYSARETVKIGPSLTRLYPTIVIDDTELYNQYKRGEYAPLSREEAVYRTKEMYKILDDAGITIMRVGLKSTDLINEGGFINGGTYHPAFRQLVEGAIAKERIEELIKADERLAPYLAKGAGSSDFDNSEGAGNSFFDQNRRIKVDIYSNSAWFSNMIGNCKENKKYFLANYPKLNILYKVDNELENGKFKIRIKGE